MLGLQLVPRMRGRVVNEFLRALCRKGTYLPHLNAYTRFGILWGLPVPVVTAMLYLTVSGQPITLSSALQYLTSGPIQLFILAHPVLFGVIFGAIGTINQDKQRQVDALLAQLRREADTDGLTGC